MPARPRSRCTEPRCPNLTERPGRCPECRREADRRLKGRHTWRDYGPRHQRLRRQLLREQPTCQACKTAPATIADHVIPLRNGGRTERANLQALCAPCHNRKTARENHAGGTDR